MFKTKYYPNPFNLIIAVFVLAVMFTGVAEAGVFGKIKELLNTQVWAWIATGGLALLGVTLGTLFNKILITTKEATTFLDALATAVQDKKISKQELEDLIAKGKLVVDAFKKTPSEFKVN